jgi:uncharacterized protein (DUF1778 family)
MARTNLKVISVYLNDRDYTRVQNAAALQNRSMSNFLHTIGVAAAQDVIEGQEVEERKPGRKQKAS